MNTWIVASVALACLLVTAYAAEGATSTGQVAAIRQLALEKDPASAGALREGLTDADAIVRRLAIYGLQRIGDPSAGKAILPLLADGDSWVRRTAATALGKLRDRNAATALAAAITSDDVHLRYEAFIALGRIGEASTQPAILAALPDKRLWTELPVWDQMALLAVLDREWFTDPAAKDVLVWLLDYGQWSHPELADLEPSRKASSYLLIANRAACILATKFGDDVGGEWIVKGLGADPHMQQGSARAAGKVKLLAAVEPLKAMLDQRWLLNRRYALTALGEIGDASATEAVAASLTHEDIRVRRTAAAAYTKITGNAPEADLAEPAAAEIPEIAPADLKTPGGKRPPQFISLGVDDCVNIEGLEAILDIVETLGEHDRKVVFTLWLAPLMADAESRDILKQTLILQRLFDLGTEIAHHTLHHNPGGRNWASLSQAIQIEEIEGCTRWYRENLTGYTRPFTHKGGGGGQGAAADREWTRQLLAKQSFIYRGRGGQHPNEQMWPTVEDYTVIPAGMLDAAAPPVHATITDGITSDYPGRFDYEIPEGAAMWKANFDYHYRHPRRPIVAVNAFHDWAFKTPDDSTCTYSHRNEGRILKAFLMDVLVTNRDKYPDTHVVTFRQVLEYARTNGDLARTLAIGNGQDSRNPAMLAAVGDSVPLIGGTVTVKNLDVTPVVRNQFSERFNFDVFGNAAHAQLRQQEKLDEVHGGVDGEFDRQVRLMDWTYKRFKRFNAPSAKVKTALEIVAAIDEGHTFNCGYYARVLRSALMSFGHPTRSIGLKGAKSDGNGSGHSILEVWSNEHRKWVVLDPTLNLYFTKAGVPLNAYEIRQEWFENDGADLTIVIVDGAGRSQHSVTDLPIKRAYHKGFGNLGINDRSLGKFLYIAYVPLTESGGPNYSTMFITKDERCEGVKWHTRICPDDPATEPYWPMHQAAITLTPDNDLTVGVGLETMTPDFADYRYRIDGGSWTDGTLRLWALHAGSNKLEVVAVNKFGQAGVPSVIELDVR